MKIMIKCFNIIASLIIIVTIFSSIYCSINYSDYYWGLYYTWEEVTFGRENEISFVAVTNFDAVSLEELTDIYSLKNLEYGTDEYNNIVDTYKVVQAGRGKEVMEYYSDLTYYGYHGETEAEAFKETETSDEPETSDRPETPGEASKDKLFIYFFTSHNEFVFEIIDPQDGKNIQIEFEGDLAQYTYLKNEK